MKDSTMPELPGNPYATASLDNGAQGSMDFAAQATLALAYEQRTANLIALARLIHEQPASALAGKRSHIEAEIATSLGLSEPARGGRSSGAAAGGAGSAAPR